MARQKNRTFKYTSRLDWLQLTAFTQPEKAQDFADHFYDLKRKLNALGLERAEFNIPRYKGERIGPFSFFYNVQTDHRMILASGGTAPELAKYAKESGLIANPSRVDGALTMEFDEPQPGYGEWARSRIHGNDEAKGRKLRTAMELYDERHADSGIRSKAREADIKWRLYDWGFLHQGRDDSRIWRMEVQLHNDPAKKFFHEHQASSDPDTLTSQMVATRFEKLGVKEPLLANLDRMPLSGTRKVTSTEKKLLYVDKYMMPGLVNLAVEGCRTDLIAMFRAHGLIDENGVFLPERQPTDTDV